MPNQNKPSPQTSLTGYATQGAQMQQGRANGKQRELNADELLNMNPADLNKYITSNYVYAVMIPGSITSIEELMRAQPVLSRSGQFSVFMESMRLTACIQKGVFKNAAALELDKDKKAAFKKQEDEMRQREQIFKSAVDRLDKIYSTTSRLISMKATADKTDNMNKGNA